jgi:hypothetical protein
MVHLHRKSSAAGGKSVCGVAGGASADNRSLAGRDRCVQDLSHGCCEGLRFAVLTELAAEKATVTPSM